MNVVKKIYGAVPEEKKYVFRRVRRHTRWRLSKLKGSILTKEDIISNIKELGVEMGEIILVHSSMSRLGHVEGGADTVIDALLEAVGPDGTVLMPTYPITGDWIEYLKSDPIFYPLQSPSSTGKITDVFWRREGVLRSLHPTHSVSAFGKYAFYLIQDHEQSPSPCGNPSPFRKLVELNGQILHLGSSFATTTSFHVVEDMLPNFPKKVYLDEPLFMKYIDFEGIEHAVPVMVHDPTLALKRIEKFKHKEIEIFNYCRENGIVKSGKIGLATAHLINAHGLENLLEKLAKKGITIYI